LRKSFFGTGAGMFGCVLISCCYVDATRTSWTSPLPAKSKVHGGATGLAIKEHPDELCFRIAQAQGETVKHGHLQKSFRGTKVSISGYFDCCKVVMHDFKVMKHLTPY
jgi:hypothetical protein